METRGTLFPAEAIGGQVKAGRSDPPRPRLSCSSGLPGGVSQSRLTLRVCPYEGRTIDGRSQMAVGSAFPKGPTMLQRLRKSRKAEKGALGPQAGPELQG